MLSVDGANFFRRLNGYKFPRLGGTANNAFYKLMPDEFVGDLFPHIKAPLKKSDLTQRSTYWQGSRFEYPTAQILQGWINSDTTHFFDVGSNYGFFSYWMLSQSPEIQVYAFEPNPVTYALVKRIITDNNLHRMQAWNLGLSNESAQLELHPGVEDSGHSTFGNNPQLPGKNVALVEVCPFVEWLKRANLTLPPRPSWIAKIDVEGFEMKVLLGMEEALRAKAFQGLVVEVNAYTLEFCQSSIEEVLTFIQSCGYKRIPPLEHGNAFFVPA